MFRRLVILASLALTLFAPSAASAERRVALVIGNANYSNAASLRNPRNDAADMAETLKKLGFEVELGVDLDQKKFATTIENFARSLDGADVGLFYYAGHGLQLNDRNYLVSVNAKLENEFLLASETIDLTSIVRLMESKTTVNLVFLDACRNNPLAENLRRGLEATKRSTALGRGLARLEPTGRDTLIAFAAAPGQVAADGTDRNSPFTASLLRNIPRPKVEVSVMLKEVSADVRRATANVQRPQQLSDMSRTFYFAPDAAAVASDVPEQQMKTASSAAPAQDDRAFDVAFWNAAQSANDCDSTRAYLQRFPNGVFVDLARLAERRLCVPSRQVTVVESSAPTLTPAPPAPPAAPAVPVFVPPETLPEPPALPPSAVASLPEPTAALPAAVPEDQGPELQRMIQNELVRLGCSTADADADGDWGAASRAAVTRFNRHAKASLDPDAPSSEMMSALRNHEKRVCPLQCGRGTRAQGDACVAVERAQSRNRKGERTPARPPKNEPAPARYPRMEAVPLRPVAPPRPRFTIAPQKSEFASPLCQSRIQNAAGKWCCTYDPPRGAPVIICP
jgi:uncharacterized caspase-like protein